MEDNISEIKNKVDIVELINKYVPLKKAGINFSGLCPFHQEKTPSFMVSPHRQSYKCFGCNESGDCLDFIMKIEGLEFYEALKFLAEQVGVELKPFGRDDDYHRPYNQSVTKTRLYELNAFMAKLWHQILLKHPQADIAREYLRSRNINNQSIINWQIGFAPPYNTTLKLLANKGFTVKEHQEAGAPAKLEGRITFPIKDLVGKTIGFTGRLIKETESANRPKYWNTPETIIFHKGRTIYGLDQAKNPIRQEDLAILVEGQMDVIALHQAGFQTAVASSGTALTEDHLKLLKRFTLNLVLAFDQDKAGQDATKRVLELAFSQDIIPEVVIIPQGKDPAELVNLNLNLWQESLVNRQNFISWLIDYSIERFGDSDGKGKKQVVNEVVFWLKKIINPVERNHWIKFLNQRLNISENSILESIRTNREPTKAKESISKVEESFSENNQPDLLLIGLISRYPQIFSSLTDKLKIFKQAKNLILQAFALNDQDLSFEQLEKKFTDQEQKNISQAHLIASHKYPNLTIEQAKEEALLLIQRLKSQALDDLKTKFAQEIAKAEKVGDRKKVKELINRLQNVIMKANVD